MARTVRNAEGQGIGARVGRAGRQQALGSQEAVYGSGAADSWRGGQLNPVLGPWVLGFATVPGQEEAAMPL
jgi:hypothetical protein